LKFYDFQKTSPTTSKRTAHVHNDNTIRSTVVINTSYIGLSSTIQTVTLYTFSLLAELHSYAYTSHCHAALFVRVHTACM